MLTWKRLTDGFINGKYNLTLIPNKQSNEVIFSQKSISHNLSHPPITLNEKIITKCNHQKHNSRLSINLNFNTHIDQKLKSVIN